MDKKIGKEKVEVVKQIIREAWTPDRVKIEPLNHNNIIIFAFRYGLKRRTGAPLMIANYIKANIDQLNDEDIRQIVRDVEGYTAGQISEDWFELLDFLREKARSD